MSKKTLLGHAVAEGMFVDVPLMVIFLFHCLSQRMHLVLMHLPKVMVPLKVLELSILKAIKAHGSLNCIQYHCVTSEIRQVEVSAHDIKLHLHKVARKEG